MERRLSRCRSGRIAAGWVVPAVLALAALAQGIASHWVGFLTGDDLEVLEAAFVPVTGLPYRAWDIRNLLFPRLLVSPVLWLGRALGLHDNLDLARLAVAPFILLTCVNALLVFRLAKRLTTRRVAVVATAVFSCHWLPLVYGGTVYPRTASTTCVLLAALALARKGGGAVYAAAAGGLVGLAFAERYSEAIYLAPFLLYVLWEADAPWGGRVRRAAALALGFAGCALLTVGLGDFLWWGRPFASLMAFARYTLVERRASAAVVHQPALWYFARLYSWLPLALIPFLVAAWRRSGLRLVWLTLALPLIQLSVIHHKELRYLQGMVPFLAIATAVGVVMLWDGGWRKTTVALLVIALGLSLNTARQVLSRKSLAAVEVALALRREAAVRRVAFSQAWAFGDLLFLRDGVEQIALANPPAPDELTRALATADRTAIFSSDLEQSPQLTAIVAASHAPILLHAHAWYSKPVTVLGAAAPR